MDNENHKPMGLDIASDFPAPTWEEWKKSVEDTLKGVPFEKAMLTKTYEGITLQPIYRKEDLLNLKHLNSLPGQAPFVRGNTAEGNRENGWIIAQQQNAWHPAEANKIILDELNRGLTGLNLKLDFFTKSGMNPPSTEIDPDGIWLSNLEDMNTLLNGVDLHAIPLFINGGEASLMILGLLNAHLIQKKQLSTNLNGFVGFDLLSELVVEGDLCFEKDDMWQTAYQLSAWAAVKAPGLRTILLDGTVWGNYGASSMHELAYVMATANECISAMLDKGLSLENIIPRFQLNLNLGSNLFMEIAKVRAARLLWAELLSSYGAPAEMQKIWIHGVTAYFNKTMYDPYVNMLRTTTEGFSGVIGGVDSLEILPFDCTIRPDEEFSRRIARNQQIILKEEANLDKVIDPAGGCYYIETITAELAELAWKKLQSIEETGGMYHAIKSAVIQNELAKMAMERMQNVDKRKDIFVGINMFANPIEMPLDEGDAPCDCAYQEYLDKIEAYQQTKRAGVDKAIQDLQEHHKDIMVIDNITEALQLGATLDELFPSLYPNDWDLNAPDLLSCRATIGLEGLRERHTDYQQDNEIVLSVFLANMGDVPQHKARADFATGFLQVGGFYIAGNDGFKTVDEAVEAAVFSKAQAVCICSTDNTYPEIVPEFINKMKTKSPNMIYILAGYPTDMVDTYAKDGIDLFIHMRANLLDTLAVLGAKMGVEK